MAKETPNIIYAAEMALCLKEINIPKMFLEDSLRKMAKQLQSAPDKDAHAVKQLSYYAQILHSALLSINAAQDAVSALSLLMSKNEQL